MKRLNRSKEDKQVAGVCMGLGQYFNVDPVLFRIMFIVFAFVGGIGVLGYVALWILVSEGTEAGTMPQHRLYLSTDDVKWTGVCGGLGEFFNIDPVFFRLLFIILTFCAFVGIILYLIMWVIIPERNKDCS